MKRYRIEKVYSWSGGLSAVNALETMDIYVRPALSFAGYRLVERASGIPLKTIYETMSEARKAKIKYQCDRKRRKRKSSR